jgi:hypothetical protein
MRPPATSIAATAHLAIGRNGGMNVAPDEKTVLHIDVRRRRDDTHRRRQEENDKLRRKFAHGLKKAFGAVSFAPQPAHPISCQQRQNSTPYMQYRICTQMYAHTHYGASKVDLRQNLPLCSVDDITSLGLMAHTTLYECACSAPGLAKTKLSTGPQFGILVCGEATLPPYLTQTQRRGETHPKDRVLRPQLARI